MGFIGIVLLLTKKNYLYRSLCSVLSVIKRKGYFGCSNIRGKRGRGRSTNVDKDFLYVLGFFKGISGLFNAYLVVFGLFLAKAEEKKLKIPTENN